MLKPTEPTIKENKLFSFTHMAEALDKVHMTPICANPKALKGYLKTVTIDLELFSLHHM